MKDIFEKLDATIGEQLAKWIAERDRLVADAARITKLDGLIAEAQGERAALQARSDQRG